MYILLIRFMTFHIVFKLQTKIGLMNFYMLTTTFVVEETASVANLSPMLITRDYRTQHRWAMSRDFMNQAKYFKLKSQLTCSSTLLF